MIEHSAQPGTWDCRACGQPWPCTAAKEQLAGETNSLELATYLWLCFDEATADLTTVSGRQLYDRFVGWNRSRPRPE